MTTQVDVKLTVTASEMEARYRRAEALVQGLMTTSLVQNDTIFPTWIEGGDCFWYKRAYKIGKDAPVQLGHQYRLVNAKSATNEIAFDHETFASALAKASGQQVVPEALPITYVSLTLSPLTVSFTAFDQRWIFDADKQYCQAPETPFINTDEARSPDGKWIAFPRDNNLWLRDVTTGEERALTNDGEPNYAYGIGHAIWGRAASMQPGLWSPDSTRLLTVRRDLRQVKTLSHINHIPADGSFRPQLEEYKVAYPGDKQVETFRMLTLDAATSRACDADCPPSPAGYDGDICPFFKKLTWWAADNRHAYFIDRTRGQQVLRLMEFDSDTGATRVVIEETSKTYVNSTPDNITYPLNYHLPKTREMIWWSERSGYGHLYLYDLTSGQLKRAITSGEWMVRDILHVDENRRELLIQTSGKVAGRDPYYRDICRLHIDTGEITTLLSGDEEYLVHYPETALVILKNLAGETNEQTAGVSPSGDYLVVTRTRADQVPTNLLIDRDGKIIMELEVADISSLPAEWQWPEPVKLLAADQATDIYGLLFRPSNFSPEKNYPVINFINSGPWLAAVPKGSFNTARGYSDRHYFQAAAMAELGFIVLLLDSRGTPLRNKAFQEESYGWIPSSANTDDHAIAIEQLSQRYPYMDVNRVGICGNAYHTSLQNFLERQDLYKVGVQMWLIDTRMMCGPMGERFEGIIGPSDDKRYPEQLVDKLTGKLLILGAMNSFITSMYPPACTLRVIDALHKANKDFDMLMVATVDFGPDNYMQRRAWDYLVKNLQGTEPPKEFKLGEVNWLGGTTEDLLE